MHFSIPDTQEFICDRSGSNFTGYNIHINGCFHCCLRYKQIHCLHEQLKRSHPGHVLPQFPSKRLLPLTNNQLEQRRISLERYLQVVGQDAIFSKSELLRTFLLSAQQESSFTQSHEVNFDVFLMNGYRISVSCYTVDCTSRVLEKTIKNIDLAIEFLDHFALYLMRTEKDGGIKLVRKLMDFEAPYITQRQLDGCQIVIRKSYWDPVYDQTLMHNSIALNLLYILTLSDIDCGWIMTTPENRQKLNALQAKGDKKEYLEISRSLPLYGCIKFTNAIVDYPKSNEAASILIGQKELSIQTLIGEKCQETKFKVTRMRCWRVTTNYSNEEITSISSGDSGQSSSSSSGNSGIVDNNGYHTMELSFEYLISKNSLRWITITSEQAMLMSVCLQSIVDELLCQKDDYDFSRLTQKQQQVKQAHQMVLSYIRRDGKMCNSKQKNHTSSHENSSHPEIDLPLNINRSAASLRKKVKERISTTVLFRNGKESVHNEAFEEIGDDDL